MYNNLNISVIIYKYARAAVVVEHVITLGVPGKAYTTRIIIKRCIRIKINTIMEVE